MMYITQEALVRLARASRLHLPEDGAERLGAKLESVLSYAAQLATIRPPAKEPIAEAIIEVLRSDIIVASPADAMMARAPLQIERYFVVPVVIKEPA